MKAGRIGIIVSVPSEGGIVAGKLKKTTDRLIRVCTGAIHNRTVLLAVSGMGKVNAAHAAAMLILAYRPSLMVNIGIGGAYPSSGLMVGDIAIAEKEIYGDEGVILRDGFHGIGLIGIPLLRKGRKTYFNELPLDRKLVQKAVRALVHDPLPFALKAGRFLTVSTCSGTTKRARELEKRFGVICENMEGAAIAHICAMYDVPFLEMRGISNVVEDRDRSGWNVKLAAENVQKAALELLRVV